MEIKIDIPFEQLMQLVKQLPDVQLKKLKAALNDTKKMAVTKQNDVSAFQKFLLKGPVFSEDQVAEINENRKRINQWRTK